MVMFNTRMRPEVIQPFWAALQAGQFIDAAADGVGTYRVKGQRWILAESGIRPRRGRHLQGRCLTFSEREEIALGRARGIGAVHRPAAGSRHVDLSRELSRNRDRHGTYRATSAHALAWQRATITALELDRVAEELNDRPRKRLGFYKPTERLAELLLR